MSAENELIKEKKFRCSPIAILPLILCFLAFLFLAIYYTLLLPFSVQYIDLFDLIGADLVIPVPLFFIIPLLILGYVLHTLYDAAYIIGKDYVRATYGFLSFEKKDVRLEFVDIRGIEIHRGIYGRIVNTGTLHVGTAMREEEEMFIFNVFNPSKYRDLILKRRSHIQIKEQNETVD